MSNFHPREVVGKNLNYLIQRLKVWTLSTIIMPLSFLIGFV